MWLLTLTAYSFVLYYIANTFLINPQTDWYIDKILSFHRQWNSDIKAPEESLAKCREHSSEQPGKGSAA